MTLRNDLSRRHFIARAGSSLALLPLPAFLARAVSAAPSARVVTGHVGVGGRGGSLLSEALAHPEVSVAAVCDVDAKRRAAAYGRVGKQAGSFNDYRRLIARKDIDAVVVAAPDHWHAGVTIAACRAGKDVYVEKPLSHNIAEGRAMVDEARKNGRVVSTGQIGEKYIQLRGSALYNGGICRPRVFVDGVMFLPGDGRRRSLDLVGDLERVFEEDPELRLYDALSIDDIAHPSTIAAIEVYRSGAQVPAQFGGTSTETQCGVIVVWTRVGSMRNSR